MTRQDIFFESDGLKCAGTLVLPDTSGRNRPVPAVVLAHGFGTVRTMRNIPEVTRELADAGIGTLAIDYRNLGDSEGTPRQRVSALAMFRDLINAISWLSTCEGVDPNRIGLWGTSFSGGLVLQVAAFDRRVKAVVSQVPATDLFRQLRQAPAAYREFLNTLIAEGRIRQSHEPKTIKVAAPQGEASLFGEASWAWMQRALTENPNFQNEVTISSIEELVQFNPGNYIEGLSPTPLLMIVANQDQIVSLELTFDAFRRAADPKKLVTYDGGHYDVYDLPEVALMAANEARAWFERYL